MDDDLETGGCGLTWSPSPSPSIDLPSDVSPSVSQSQLVVDTGAMLQDDPAHPKPVASCFDIKEYRLEIYRIERYEIG